MMQWFVTSGAEWRPCDAMGIRDVYGKGNYQSAGAKGRPEQAWTGWMGAYLNAATDGE